MTEGNKTPSAAPTSLQFEGGSSQNKDKTDDKKKLTWALDGPPTYREHQNNSKFTPRIGQSEHSFLVLKSKYKADEDVNYRFCKESEEMEEIIKGNKAKLSKQLKEFFLHREVIKDDALKRK